jgi:hypothetical protein
MSHGKKQLIACLFITLIGSAPLLVLAETLTADLLGDSAAKGITPGNACPNGSENCPDNPGSAASKSSNLAAQGASQIVSSCAGNLLETAIGYPIGLITKAKNSAAVSTAQTTLGLAAVPTVNVLDVPKESLGSAGDTQVGQTGAFWEALQQTFTEKCLKPLQRNIAKIIIRTMRDMVLNWIQTGNFGGPLFVTNFQADFRQIASNAARSYASQLTGINFCSFAPISPRNIRFSVSLQLQLQCSVQAPRAELVKSIQFPGSNSIDRDLLMQFPQFNPLTVQIDTLARRAAAIDEAVSARNTQVTAGQGFIGAEGPCLKTEIVSPAQTLCDAGNGCQTQPAVTRCVERQIVTPGAYIKDYAVKSTSGIFDDNTNVEFGEALAQIIDAALGKVINQGLLRAGL